MMEEEAKSITFSVLVDENIRAIFSNALIEENHKELAKNKVLEEQITELKQRYAEKGLELDRANDEIVRLNNQINSAKGEGCSDPPPFIVSASRTHFKDREGHYPPREWVTSYWLHMNDLANTTEHQGKMLISNESHIVYVFKVISEDNKLPYNYCGTRKDFATEWNDNVAERQEGARKEKLICKSNTLSTAINRSPCKNTSVTSWHSLAISGSQYANYFAKGDKIKVIIESFT